jgi:hypothetical protein
LFLKGGTEDKSTIRDLPHSKDHSTGVFAFLYASEKAEKNLMDWDALSRIFSCRGKESESE